MAFKDILLYRPIYVHYVRYGECNLQTVKFVYLLRQRRHVFFCPAVKFINNTARIGFRTPNDFKKISRNVNRNVHRRRLNSVETHMDKGDGRQVR